MARKADTDADIATLESVDDSTAVAVYVDSVTDMSYEELLAASVKGDVNVRTADEFDPDDGFIFVDREHKAQLCGSQFFIVDAKFFPSDDYVLGVRVKVITSKGNRVKFVDFSTSGVMNQLTEAFPVDQRKANPNDPTMWEWPDRQVVAVPNGLVRSEYGPKKLEDGTIRPGGVTYYLDTSGGQLPAGTL